MNFKYILDELREDEKNYDHLIRVAPKSHPREYEPPAKTCSVADVRRQEQQYKKDIDKTINQMGNATTSKEIKRAIDVLSALPVDELSKYIKQLQDAKKRKSS